MVAAQDVPRRSAASRNSVEQRVGVAALGSGMKENAMWHVPHHDDAGKSWIMCLWCECRCLRRMKGLRMGWLYQG